MFSIIDDQDHDLDIARLIVRWGTLRIRPQLEGKMAVFAAVALMGWSRFLTSIKQGAGAISKTGRLVTGQSDMDWLGCSLDTSSPKKTNHELYLVLSMHSIVLRAYAIFNDNTQNTRFIRLLGSAIDKMFNIYSASSPTTRPKRESFLQIGFQERWYPYLGCVSQVTQNRSPVYVLCWRLVFDLLLSILSLGVHMSSNSLHHIHLLVSGL